MLKYILKWPRLGLVLLFFVVGALAPFFVFWRTEQLNTEKAVQKEEREEKTAALTYQQPAISLSAGEMPIVGTMTDSKTIALMIDNSWNNTVSSLLIFALKSNHAHATFLVAGKWASEHPDICRLLVREGNELGILGNQHEEYDRNPPEWIKSDIEKSASQIKGVSGAAPTLFSAGKNVNPSVVKAAAGAGFLMIMGGIDANNLINMNQDMIIGRLLQSTVPGSIVVFHVPAASDNFASTIDAFLQRMEQQNYKVVSVSELLSKYKEKGIVRKSL